MDSLESSAAVHNRRSYRKRHRILRSCVECHRRKQKCNRLQPCQHCKGRAKPELCLYENIDKYHGQRGATDEDSAGSGESTIASSAMSHSSPLSLSSEDHTNLVSVLGYSTHSAHNPLSLVKQAVPTPPSTSGLPPTLTSKQTALDHKYGSLIRQLPSKEHIDILVQQFFSDINWQYDVIDEIAFLQQLEDWRRIPYSAHSNATSVLPANVFAFPSLLFQLMAHALIHQPVTEGTCSSLDSLKYASDMTFVDLACDFSKAGYLTLETMRHEDVTVVAVQSEILRASLLKNTGNVIEAWHVLGAALRSAQELGFHAESASQDWSASIDAQWDRQIRRRIWFVLHNWDIHMAVVLGRPITTTLAGGTALSLPDDLAHREIGAPPRERTLEDPPTPSSVIRVGYDVAYRYFPLIRDLENRGARTEDYSIVQETHAAILKKMEHAPHWCSHDDPDEHFDGLPGCRWLPAARQALTSGIYFVLLSLHRPYIFTVAESRTQVLMAALKILTVQRRLSHLSAPQQYISFNMVYPLFDAMVISLATIVLFPDENPDILSELVQNLRWGIDMLGKVGERNAMAKAAYAVVKRLFWRFEPPDGQALQQSSHTSEGTTEHSDAGTAGPRWSKACLDRDHQVGNIDAEVSSLAWPQTDLGSLNPPNFDAETLLPPQPVHDLFFQDISAPAIHGAFQALDLLMDDPEFDGYYPENSFWSFMNNFSAL